MCGARNCEECAGPQEGCAACNDGLYAFPSTRFGRSSFNLCYSCQDLNCAAGGCSGNIGASTTPGRRA